MAKKEIVDRWNDLGIADTVKTIVDEVCPEANFISQKTRKDGLVEIVAQEHDGFEDQNPNERMRFSFDGQNLLVSMSKNGEPALDLISTQNLDRSSFEKSLREIVVR